MVAVPAATPVTVPLLTVAMPVSLLLQVTFLFVALAGAIVYARVSVPLRETVVEVLFNETPVTGTSTVTVHVAVMPPSCVTTNMAVLPAATPVTVPLLTVAMAVLLLNQVTFLLVALAGAIVAVKVSGVPKLIVVEFLFNETPVTGIASDCTVTVHVAVLLPSAVVAVMVAGPAFTPVTVPLLTVAMVVSLLLQVTFWLVAVAGRTVAVRSIVPWTEMVADVGANVTPVTATTTVTVHVAVLPPSFVRAIMVAVPAATPVTVPPLTVAMPVLLLTQVTSLSVAVAGRTVAVRVSVPLRETVAEVLSNETLATDTLFTVTLHVAVLVPLVVSAAVAVMVAVPGATPVTNPPMLTVATPAALVLHVTFWLVAFVGAIVAVRVSVPP